MEHGSLPGCVCRCATLLAGMRCDSRRALERMLQHNVIAPHNHTPVDHHPRSVLPWPQPPQIQNTGRACGGAVAACSRQTSGDRRRKRHTRAGAVCCLMLLCGRSLGERRARGRALDAAKSGRRSRPVTGLTLSLVVSRGRESRLSSLETQSSLSVGALSPEWVPRHYDTFGLMLITALSTTQTNPVSQLREPPRPRF